MSQATTWGVPQTGPATPTEYAQRDQASFNALLTAHSGYSRPSYATANTIWVKLIDASESEVYIYDGTSDIYIGNLDLTNHMFFPVVNGTVLTATGDEINTACDGITATASEVNTACDGITATASELNDACDGAGVSIPLQVIVNMGDWDMNSTAFINVSHGLDYTNIVGARATIRGDNGTRYPFPGGYSGAQSELELEITGIDATYIYLTRLNSGYYAGSSNFNSTSYNRGWVIIDYIN